MLTLWNKNLEFSSYHGSRNPVEKVETFLRSASRKWKSASGFLFKALGANANWWLWKLMIVIMSQIAATLSKWTSIQVKLFNFWILGLKLNNGGRGMFWKWTLKCVFLLNVNNVKKKEQSRIRKWKHKSNDWLITFNFELNNAASLLTWKAFLLVHFNLNMMLPSSEKHFDWAASCQRWCLSGMTDLTDLQTVTDSGRICSADLPLAFYFITCRYLEGMNVCMRLRHPQVLRAFDHSNSSVLERETFLLPEWCRPASIETTPLMVIWSVKDFFHSLKKLNMYCLLTFCWSLKNRRALSFLSSWYFGSVICAHEMAEFCTVYLLDSWTK